MKKNKGMTVSELIEELLKYNPEAEVIFTEGYNTAAGRWIESDIPIRGCHQISYGSEPKNCYQVELER